MSPPLTFASLLIGLKVSEAQDGEADLSESPSSESFGFFSHESVTSVLFIVHVVVIVAFLVSHCRKAETLSISKTDQPDDKLKQQ